MYPFEQKTTKAWHAFVAVSLMLVAGAATAKKAGDTIVSLGALSINNSRSSSSNLHTELGDSLFTRTGLLPKQFDSAGTELTVGNAVTPMLTITHFFTNNMAVTNVLGLPPKFDIHGRGRVTTPGPLGAVVPPVVLDKEGNNPVASVLQWSPTVLLQYYFGDASATLRPYLSVGGSYNFFTHVELNDNFKRDLQNSGGYLAFANTGDRATTVEARATPSFRPVFGGGIGIGLSERWSANIGISFLPLKTDSIITLKDKNGNTVLTSSAHMDIPAVATNFTLGYQF
ncbi:MAG: outer membrane protein [Janthinobacterium sp.]